MLRIIQRLIRSFIRKPKFYIDEIERDYLISIVDIQSDSRKRDVVKARHKLIMRLACYTDLTNVGIAKIVNKDVKYVKTIINE